MSLSLLDNPAWHALNSHHQHLAIKRKSASRYQPGIFPAAGMPENKPTEFGELRSLVDVDEIIGVAGVIPKIMEGWEVTFSGPFSQMICDELKYKPQIDTVSLTVKDVPEILDLVELTQPGLFYPRTIETGQYIGIRKNSQLVAMAGERFHLPGFCEISTVCTHPEYRGRGYASALTAIVAKNIYKRQEIPFLHVLPTNEVAMNVYKKLGFQLRKELVFTMLKRVA